MIEWVFFYMNQKGWYQAMKDYVFNNSLLEKAISVAGGISTVAKAAGMKPDALRRSLKNKREFTVQEINALSVVLNIPSSKINTYFFSVA